MKNFLFLAVLFGISQCCLSQTVDKIFKSFSSADKAEEKSIDLPVVNITQDKSLDLTSLISSIQVLTLESCSEEIKADFRKNIKQLKDDKYETLVKVQGKENAHILKKREKGSIKELVIINEDEPVIIKIKGEFNLSDIDGLISQDLKL